MTDIQNVDAGNKVDLDRVIELDHMIDVIDHQIMAIDLLADTKYAQPLIDKKFREVQNPPSHADTKATSVNC